MAFSKYKNLFVLLILLSLYGQTVSYASLSCSMKHSSEMPTTAKANIDHCNSMAVDTETTPENFNCCDKDGDCPMSGCVSTALPADTLLHEVHQAPSGVINLYSFAFAHPVPTAFYRPPIAR